MTLNHFITQAKRYIDRLNGCTIDYDLAPYRATAAEIRRLDLSSQSGSSLRRRADGLMTRARSGENLDGILVEAFALIRESIRRVLRLEPFDEQIIGGIALHQGKLAEMQTGEGKTLAAVFPAFLNALTGAGVHVMTFNDYLARRDAQWMGPVYEFLGLRVGFVQEGMSPADRRRAYAADITYLTAKESGFDFLRDGLCRDSSHIVRRGFSYAIIDEADSILVDESRVPLIIAEAGPGHEADPATLTSMSALARRLKDKQDFDFDTYSRNCHLTETGTKWAETVLGCGNLYEEANGPTLSRLCYALHAEHILRTDHDYIVRNGKVELVDEFTGRVADKRRWPDGLQAAVEAKEGLIVQSKGVILNSIALQHFLRLYPKLSGMTATAQIAEEDLRVFYGLHIVVIPPHRTCIRGDEPDRIFPTKAAKRQALLDEITRTCQTRRPILVGTRTIEESAELAGDLEKLGVRCEVLNAKRDEFEAHIIAQAGRLGAVTISTNMAGRGTDIRLGGADEAEKARVVALGGLCVIGTNRYESRRVDDQLRGRAGRQGDPGTSRFFISLDDDLFVRFRLRELIPASAPDAIDNPIIRGEINRIQRIIEGQNVEIKRTLFKYTFMIEQQRANLARQRGEILDGNDAPEFFRDHSRDHFAALMAAIGPERLFALCKELSLACLDRHWSRYLAEINEVRDGIHLRRLGKQDPLFEFHKIAIEMFGQLQDLIDQEMIESFNRITVDGDTVDLRKAGIKAPSATWTYLINDDPFADKFDMQLGDVGFSAFAGVAWPLTLLYLMAKRWKRREPRNEPRSP